MKILLTLFVLTFGATTFSATAHAAQTLQAHVNGMVCAFCAQGIEKTLRGFDATEDVLVSLEHRLVAVALREGKAIDETALRRAIVDAGYTPVQVRYTDTALERLRATIREGSGDDE